MTTAIIRGSVLRGRVRAPPSKSYTHRALLAGFLTGRPYHVHRPSTSEDTRATREGLRNLGCAIELRRNGWTLHPPARGAPVPTETTIHCGASGTTLRFLAALAARAPSTTVFRGSLRLAHRPMEGLLEALRHGGVTTGTPAGNRTLPLTIRGPLQPGKFVVDGAASSQFLSALLFVLPTLDGPSRVCITGPRVSRPYVAATLAVLAAHGVRVSEAPDGWEIPGRQRFQGRQFFVTGDASSAAYLWVAAALGAGQVTVSGLDPKWPQADLQVLEVLRELGARVRRHGRNITVEGPVHGSFSAELSDAPDLYPLLGVLAALQPGKTSELRGAPQARQKESDRRAGTLRLARALGAQARSGVDAVTITGGPTPRRLELSGLNDHRLFMSATVAALSLGGTSRLRPAEAPGKSFPGFLATLRALGGEVR